MGKKERNAKKAQDKSTVTNNSEIQDDKVQLEMKNLDDTEKAAGFDRSEYFDDDEEFLKGDDTTIHEANDVAIFQQLENVVSWEIENYYKDDGKPRNRLSLRNDPPILKISNSSGENASFVISKEFSGSLSKLFSDIERSYYGVSEKRMNNKAIDSKDRISDFVNFVKRHGVLFILGGLILGVSLFSMFFMN